MRESRPKSFDIGKKRSIVVHDDKPSLDSSKGFCNNYFESIMLKTYIPFVDPHSTKNSISGLTPNRLKGEILPPVQVLPKTTLYETKTMIDSALYEIEFYVQNK